MKVCSRYLDFVEREDFSCDSQEWQDVLAHAAKCSDCSLAIKTRSEMLEALNEAEEPAYPADLHQRIMTEVTEGNSEAFSISAWFDTLIEPLLRPLELGFTLACILMIFFLVTSEKDHEHFKTPATARPYTLAQNKEAPEEQARVKVAQEAGLEEVSQQEVKEFLARLEKFNRRKAIEHHKPEHYENYLPELRLVNDW
ncbi:MAG: hypothetical protein PWR01_3518 [Clostridiales bacterium]|nr:hypothetical protein [Clostridiales bacterium]MDN5282445.1 hypothetical protein [Candidatus Ozemobacter sp.]